MSTANRNAFSNLLNLAKPCKRAKNKATFNLIVNFITSRP